MEEIWKDIPDYEGLYQVSNLGRVKSLPKQWISGNGAIRIQLNEIIMSQSISKTGYYRITLTKYGKQKSYRIHQLVAIAFFGHKLCGLKLVVDHINDNKTDNRLQNLQIVTQRFNSCKTQGKYSSKYKGVYWDKNSNKWKAQIEINGIRKYIGSFDCEIKAHQSYQNALKQYNLS